jgi:hypothetical protein
MLAMPLSFPRLFTPPCGRWAAGHCKPCCVNEAPEGEAQYNEGTIVATVGPYTAEGSPESSGPVKACFGGGRSPGLTAGSLPSGLGALIVDSCR